MSLSDLIRKEAIDHQRVRLIGDVILIQPLSYIVVMAVVTVMLIISAGFLVSQNYARKENVVGYLVPDAGVVRVFADQGGVLEKFNLDAGQHIKKGDSIAVVKIERLSTNGENSQEEILLSVERNLNSIKIRLSGMVAQETHESQTLKDRLHGIKFEKQALISELSLMNDQEALAKKKYKAALKLTRNGFLSESQLDEQLGIMLSARQARSATQRQIITLDNALTDTNNSVVATSFLYAERRANLNAPKEDFLQQLANLKQVRGYTITAPVDGIVSSIFVSEGSNIRPNLPLLAIRPSGTKLFAQLLVPSRAIGLIDTGQHAKIQYDAFPYQRFGVFDGQITTISESILTSADLPTPVAVQEAFYLVDLALSSQTVNFKGKKIPLKAGMILKADIILENRTLIEWILDPLFAVTGKL